MTKRSEANKIISALADRSELVKSAWTMTEDLRTDISDVEKDLGTLGSLLNTFLTYVGEEADSPVALRGEWDQLLRAIHSVVETARSIYKEHSSLVRSKIDDETYATLIAQARQISKSIAKYEGKWQAVMAATDRANRISMRPSNTVIEKIKDKAQDIASGLLDIEKNLQKMRFTKADGKEIGIYSVKSDTPSEGAPESTDSESEDLPEPAAEKAEEAAGINPLKIKTDYVALREDLKGVLDAADIMYEGDPRLLAAMDKFSAVPAIKTFFKFDNWIQAKEAEKISNEDLMVGANKVVLEKMHKFFPAAKAAVDDLKKEIEAMEG